MAKSSTGVHVSSVPLRFKFRSFDFITQWLMGAQTHGGTELGECLYATERIQDADTASWAREWTALAGRVEKRAAHSLAQGHPVSARQSYFRAYTYYRAPLVYLNPFTTQDYEAIYQKAQSCFLRAAGLFEPPIQPVSIPFEGQQLPGYFARASAGSSTAGEPPRPTLIMLGGGDTFVEDLYAYIVPAAHARGYHVLMVDLPGQGILPNRGLPMRADAEAPMRAVVDFALTFPEVDAQRLAVYGISGGGYLAPRAAAFDPRIKALVVNTILLNFTDHWIQNAGLDRVVRLQGSLLFRALAAFHSRKLATVMNQLQIYCWRWGVQRVEDLIEVSRSFVLDPSRLTCPTYILIGEHEYQSSAISRAWIEETRQKAQGRVDLFVGPTDEGTNSHTMGTNLSLMSQMVFDWLDELFYVHPMG